MFYQLYDVAHWSEVTPEVVGGKASNLFSLISEGYNVPPGGVITCDTCMKYLSGVGYLDDLNALTDYLVQLIAQGELVSIRSGARVSMPGMMDTVLNVGIHSTTFEKFSDIFSPDVAAENYIRFLTMYWEVVLGKGSEGLSDSKDIASMSYEEKMELIDAILQIPAFEGFSELPIEQIVKNCIYAVWDSWNSPRAKSYRAEMGYPDDWGTAVIGQVMVYGNVPGKSCTGVVFSSNPDTGEDELYGCWIPQAQGEDVVAGGSNAKPIEELKVWDSELWQQLVEVCQGIENFRGDLQDIEFTIQDGELFILQTRDGKRSDIARFVFACRRRSSFGNGWFYSQVKGLSLQDLMEMTKVEATSLFSGTPASSGVVSGVVALSADKAVELSKAGKKVILVTFETKPEDVHGLFASEGVLTAIGGITSHAAVVARGIGKSCIVGAGFKIKDGSVYIADDFSPVQMFSEEDVITIDGSSGEVFLGEYEVEAVLPDSVRAAIQYLVPENRVLTVPDVGCQVCGVSAVDVSYFSSDKDVEKLIQGLSGEVVLYESKQWGINVAGFPEQVFQRDLKSLSNGVAKVVGETTAEDYVNGGFVYTEGLPKGFESEEGFDKFLKILFDAGIELQLETPITFDEVLREGGNA